MRHLCLQLWLAVGHGIAHFKCDDQLQAPSTRGFAWLQELEFSLVCRDVFSPDALPLLHEAEQQMLLQLPEEDRYKTELLSEEPAGDASAQPADVQVP